VLLLFFGLFIKGTDEYACALETLEQSWELDQEIGRPWQPGFFAWTSYYESNSAVRQGNFSTTLTGPRGRARVTVEFYRNPVTSFMHIGMNTERGTMTIYEGEYVCP